MIHKKRKSRGYKKLLTHLINKGDPSFWPQSSSWKHLHRGRPTRATQRTQCLHVEIKGWKEEGISSSASEHRSNIPFDYKKIANIFPPILRKYLDPLHTSVYQTPSKWCPAPLMQAASTMPFFKSCCRSSSNLHLLKKRRF